ncbi:Tar [Pantoea stewartii]|uniref:methyl-accepting chemotaxis protein n=1 Tax=Pantoea stewartii TaxID=66269 RepID=UPI00054370BD|nr:methyl-accepting chemotaxis protein [Pantoea stewartii]KHE02669.1 Tar [Pantoea stewartii]KHN64543.1 Tar [Pantoea stewartii]
MQNFRIGTRLGLAFAIVLILLMIISLTALSRIHLLGDTARTLAGSRYQKAATASDLRYYSADMARLVRNFVITDDPARKAGFRKDYDALKDKTAAAMSRFDGMQMTPVERKLAAQIRHTGSRYQAFSDDVVSFGMQGKRDEAAKLLFGPRYQTQTDFIQAVRAMMTFQESQMQQAGEAAAKEQRLAMVLLTFLSVGAALLAGVLAWLITRSITRPLNTALKTAQRIAGGDLSETIPSGGRDETGRLLLAVSHMQDALVETVSNVRANAESVAAASEQIARGNADLSQRTEEQASALEQTAATMSELSVTVRNNADNARQAAQLAFSVREVARRGSDVSIDITGMMRIIGESSSRIADIISVIDSIAFQTNILALNAAVEAARAGEQGRGFAVVAGEVRMLAQRSATAAGEVRDLIEANSASVSAGSALAERSATTMTSIVTSVGQLTDTVGEITAASAEQARGIEQVGIAVTQMDGVTQQNASLVEESASASQSLKEQAALLLQSVSVFRTAAQESTCAPASVSIIRPPARTSRQRAMRNDDNWTAF